MTISLRSAALNGRHHRMVGEIIDPEPTTGKRDRKVTGGYTIVGGNLEEYKKGAIFDAENFDQTLIKMHFPPGIIVERAGKLYEVYEHTYKNGRTSHRVRQIERIGQ